MAFRQRKKGAPIVYDGKDNPIPLPWGRQENSNLPWPPGELRLKIVASPKDWETLYTMSWATPELLGRLIFKNIAEPVYEKFLLREAHPAPRGVHAHPQDSVNRYALGARELFMWQARCYVAATHTIVMHWRKRPLKEWPSYLRELEGEASLLHSNKKVKGIELTMFCFEKKFRARRMMLGMEEFIDEESFRKIYLLPEFIRRARRIYNEREESGEEVTIDKLYELMI
ncbi:MAG: hypothetical protein JRI50_11920 [Deltaproteobacteria bacterium]|nr:hypothetical protein [Deltaproteobacteria bacterium]